MNLKQFFGSVALVAIALAVIALVVPFPFARRSELMQASPQMQQELMGCARLAKEFKGTKVGARKVTQAQKTEAMRCMQVIATAHEQKKFPTPFAEGKHALATHTSGLLQSYPYPHIHKDEDSFYNMPQYGTLKTQELNFANRKPQSPYGQLPPQNFPFPHSTAAGGMPSSEEYGAKAPVSQLKMKKPFFHREGRFAKKTQQLHKMATGNKDKVFHPNKVDPISADIAYIAAHSKERPLGFTF